MHKYAIKNSQIRTELSFSLKLKFRDKIQLRIGLSKVRIGWIKLY